MRLISALADRPQLSGQLTVSVVVALHPVTVPVAVRVAIKPEYVKENVAPTTGLEGVIVHGGNATALVAWKVR